MIMKNIASKIGVLLFVVLSAGLAGAISKTAASGEIDVLDDGGFGAVTITKSITINGGGHVAGVLVSGAGANGVLVNAGAGDVVVLRGLVFTGLSGALNAVKYLGAK